MTQDALMFFCWACGSEHAAAAAPHAAGTLRLERTLRSGVLPLLLGHTDDHLHALLHIASSDLGLLSVRNTGAHGHHRHCALCIEVVQHPEIGTAAALAEPAA